MSGITLLLCIENKIYCEGLKQALSERPDIRRVRACSVAELSLFPNGEREVVLIDVRSLRDASDQVRTAATRSNGRPVVALGLDVDERSMVEAFESGAAACITSDQSIEDLVQSVQAVSGGELVCSPKVGRLMQERLSALSAAAREAERLERLSQREHHVLSLLKDHKSNKQIARELGLEVSTIKNHVHSILVKLNVQSRSEAAAFLPPASWAHGPGTRTSA